MAALTVFIPFSDCHYFAGSLNEHGYGTMRFCGRTAKAHRVAYELANGPIAAGEGYHGNVIMHTCDEPSCVNPAHLRLGTQQDNLRDKVAKGRQYRGMRHHNAKLTPNDVSAIKQAIARNETTGGIAQRYSVDPSTISHIKSGRYHALTSVTGG